MKILLVSCVIAVAAVTGFNLAQENSNMDVSLADISVMAQADGESGHITVECSNNIGGVEVYTFIKCEPGCPKKKGSYGPKDGTCTKYF